MSADFPATVYVVFKRWPGSTRWEPVHVEDNLTTATTWMERQYAGTIWERRVQPAQVKR